MGNVGEDFWLDESIDDPAALTGVLTPYPTDSIEVYSVSSLVNSVANKGPKGHCADCLNW